MTFGISPGVYPIETDQSVYVPAVLTASAAIVIQSSEGPAGVPTLITTAKQLVDTFGSPSAAYPSMYSALAYLQAGTTLWVYRATGTGDTAATIAVEDSVPALTFTLDAVGPGSWGNSVSATIAANPTGVANTFLVQVLYNGVQVEQWVCSKLVNLLDGFGKSLYIQNVINGNSQYITVVDTPSNVNEPSLSQNVTLTGGADTSSALTDVNINAGWTAFASKETYNISMLIQAGWVGASDIVVSSAMITLAESRKDCIALLDTPQLSTVSALVTWVTTTLDTYSSYAAIYAGWPLIYDSYTDTKIYVPPSGYAAQVLAYTQTVAYPWTAPAGMRRGNLNVLGVSNVFSEGDRDNLYLAAINPIQKFIGQGVQVYGQKTLTIIPSALDRINVRMLLITIESAITLALRPFVFEANDQFTQDNITSIIESYMDTVKSNEGVSDYLVVCNSSNNTPSVVSQNELIVDLYVKPVLTAEFIQLNTIVSAQGVSFTQVA